MYIVVIPWDYNSADVYGPFDTKEEARSYIKDQLDESVCDWRNKPYVTELHK